LRIIAGQLKRKKLGPVPGRQIRPTADRLRESIFNILRDRVQGAEVLDLYAGTGAMGIEALSRGAARAVFVDNSPAAVAAIKKNLAACGLEASARVIRWNAFRSLACLRSAEKRFTLVFIDPPYAAGMISATLAHLHQSEALAAGAELVVEHTPAETITVAPCACCREAVFSLLECRRYGKSLVSFFEYMV
jgi:16S rRNA (guanine(966)-N(2))-methyltransferase RsmD